MLQLEVSNFKRGLECTEDDDKGIGGKISRCVQVIFLKKFSFCDKIVCTFLCLQVSTEAAPLIQSDAQTFTIGVLPQIPGFPQLAPDCDLQITVRSFYWFIYQIISQEGSSKVLQRDSNS